MFYFRGNNRIFNKFCRGGLGLTCLLWANLVFAQGSSTVLQTGGGQPVVSEVRTVWVGADAIWERLVFDWGFATDETVAPGVFLDSFTATLQDLDGSFTAIYLTADAAGTFLAPATPGTVLIDPTSISLTPIGYPTLLPALAYQRAYQMSAVIPGQFAGRQVNIFFDLFDNQNGIASQAWFNNVTVDSVPEPGVLSLVILGGLGVCFFRRFLS
jgi:hypothetical protein